MIKQSIKLDLHGFTALDALKEVERLLYLQWRLGLGHATQIEVITGRGKIKQALIKYLTKQKIDYVVPLANTGTIIITL